MGLAQEVPGTHFGSPVLPLKLLQEALVEAQRALREQRERVARAVTALAVVVVDRA